MTFFTLLAKTHRISQLRFNKLVCYYKVPVVTHLLKSSKLYGLMFSKIFKRLLVRLTQKSKKEQEYLIRLLVRLKTVKGFKHLFGLPVNGQRSKTNANTRRKQGRGILVSPAKMKKKKKPFKLQSKNKKFVKKGMGKKNQKFKNKNKR